MKRYEGKSVFGGVAIGRIRVFSRRQMRVRCEKITDPDAEMERYRTARDAAVAQLSLLYEKALREVGEANAAIIEAHQLMLEDDDFNESVENLIRGTLVNAEYAVASTGNHLAQMFADMEDDYMRERAADVKDISGRVLRALQGEITEDEVQEPSILVATDLAPSELVQMNKKMVLSFVTVRGSLNSHTAILARTMGIPALVGTKLSLKELDGKPGIVDGFDGSIYVDPDETTLAAMQEKQATCLEQKRLLQEWKGKETITLDKKKLRLYANIGNDRDLASALENDAEGIGLLRSEFLYLERDTYPTEEEQFLIYKKIAETMAGKRVTIRTLDIGTDKKCDYFGLAPEENPALGLRGIRICLSRPEIFRTQLRALYRASAFGKISILLPMIISVAEVRKIKEIIGQVQAELNEQGIEFGRPGLGIMVETPAAVMMSAELAREVDFFSIGTNDLTQYTLAIDRQNGKLDAFYDSHHPAVLRQIQMVVEQAHQAGIQVGICGELGADRELVPLFLKMGVDELSVSPGNILHLRELIRNTDTSLVTM